MTRCSRCTPESASRAPQAFPFSHKLTLPRRHRSSQNRQPLRLPCKTVEIVYGCSPSSPSIPSSTAPCPPHVRRVAPCRHRRTPQAKKEQPKNTKQTPKKEETEQSFEHDRL